MILLLSDEGTPSRATKMAIGVMLLMSKRAWRLPVTQTLEPPLMSVVVVLEPRIIVIEVVSSPVTPHTHGVQTTCVTLSMIVVSGVVSAETTCVTLSIIVASGVPSAS